MMAEKEEAPTKLTKGGQNLIILGVAAIIVAAVTTGVSLVIYHNSGDIYLDRSRPGFLPDKEEISNDGKDESEYVFPKNGALTPQILDEYLERLEIEIKAIDAYENHLAKMYYPMRIWVFGVRWTKAVRCRLRRLLANNLRFSTKMVIIK